MKKAGFSNVTHVHQATYAGPNAGALGAVIEYPSMTALAEAETKLAPTKTRNLDKIRTILSDSIYREL